MKSEFGEVADNGDKEVFKKYKYKDAMEGLEAVFKNLTEVSKVEVPAAEEPAAPEGEAKPEEEAKPEGEAAEGGDAAEEAKPEGEGDKPALPTFDPFKDIDPTSHAGLDKIGDMLGACALKYPFFGDVIKAQVCKFEFNPECGGSMSYGGAAGLIAAVTEAGATASKEVWFSGLVGGDDFDELKEMVDRKDDILFPGVMSGWAEK